LFIEHNLLLDEEVKEEEEEEESLEGEQKQLAFRRLAKFFHDKRLGKPGDLSPEELQNVMDMVNSTHPSRKMSLGSIMGRRGVPSQSRMVMATPTRPAFMMASQPLHRPALQGRPSFGFRRPAEPAALAPPSLAPSTSFLNLTPAPIARMIEARQQTQAAIQEPRESGEESVYGKANAQLMAIHAREMKEAMEGGPKPEAEAEAVTSVEASPAPSPEKKASVLTKPLAKIPEPSLEPTQKAPRLAFPLRPHAVGGLYLCDTDEEEEEMELRLRKEEIRRKQEERRARTLANAPPDVRQVEEAEAKKKAESPVKEKPLFDFGSTALPSSAAKLPTELVEDTKGPEAPKAKPLLSLELPSSTTKLSLPSKPAGHDEPKRKRSLGEERPAQATFSFGAPPAAAKPVDVKPAQFSFASAPQQPKAEEAQPVAPSTFTFGASFVQSQPQALPTTEAKEAPKFTFGIPKPAEQPKEEQPVKTISFGAPAVEAKPAEATPSEKPVFSFGAPSATEAKAEPVKFTFGTQAVKAEVLPKEEPVKFTFGATAKTDDAKEEPVKFSFGAATLSAAPSPAPFTFGTTPSSAPATATAEPAATEPPKFKIGLSSPQAPAAEAPKPFTFGAPSPAATPVEVPKPFAFGATPAAATSAEGATPKPFTFGAAAASTTETAPKPFTFGTASQPSQPEQPKPFAFGASSAGTEKPFGFPAAATTPTPSPAPAPFTFGAKPSTQPFGMQSHPSSHMQHQTNKSSFQGFPAASPAIASTSTTTPVQATPFGTQFYDAPLSSDAQHYFYFQGQSQPFTFGSQSHSQQQQQSQDSEMMDNDEGNDMMDSGAAQVLTGFGASAFGSQPSQQSAFGASQQAQHTPFQFQSQPTPSPSPFVFGGASQSQPASQQAPFTFGQSASQQPSSAFGASSQSTFGFGASQSQPFGIPSTAPAAFGSAPSPSFGSSSQPPATGDASPGFNMGSVSVTERKISQPVSRRRR
jgi:hypothetical protein